MNLLAWRPAYECGHLLLDFQHRELFALASDALAMGPDAKPDEMDKLVGDMLLKIERHFEDEERVLMGIGYELAHRHVLEHRRILTEMRALRGRVSDRRAVARDLAEILGSHVVMEHLLETDRAYFPALRQALATGLVEA